MISEDDLRCSWCDQRFRSRAGLSQHEAMHKREDVEMGKQIETGDAVAYSAHFLRSTGQQASPDDRGGWRGTVTEIKGPPDWRLCEIDWKDRAGRPLGKSKVLDKNLARLGSPEMSSN